MCGGDCLEYQKAQEGQGRVFTQDDALGRPQRGVRAVLAPAGAH
jgi:hypothetical protein